MQPLDNETLFKLVKSLIQKGFYFITPHATMRMDQRRITEDEIIHILTEPYELAETPRWDDKYNTYRYKICGYYSKRTVVIAINFEKLVVVITVID